jgi:hypothetical protein
MFEGRLARSRFAKGGVGEEYMWATEYLYSSSSGPL